MIERPYERLLVSVAGGVATLTLNFPERRNAIGPVMVNELLWALDDAAQDEAVRSIVITGAGKAFCAGGDFGAMTQGQDGSKVPQRGDYKDLLLALCKSPKPVVARVNGHAMGGGLGIVAASTFAIASKDAKLGTPEVDVGLFPFMIYAVLERVMDRRRLTAMILFGEKLSADDAAATGLVNRAVPAEELDAAVSELTARVARKSPITLKLGLDAIADVDGLRMIDALPILQERLSRCLSTDDAREGLMAFLEKREPKWTGK